MSSFRLEFPHQITKLRIKVLKIKRPNEAKQKNSSLKHEHNKNESNHY